jgi:hypothetical protein
MTTNDDPMPLTLSREDLYELAWSKPMSELAKDFGISDVALAKRCRKLRIPVPGRGYWARVDAGQKPYRPKLPSRETDRSDSSALTILAPDDAASDDMTTAVTENDTNDAAWLAERTAFEVSPDNKIEVPAVTRTWDPAIRDIRDDLETAAKEMRAFASSSGALQKTTRLEQSSSRGVLEVEVRRRPRAKAPGYA